MKNKWPKIIGELTPEQKTISDDFMQYWHETLSKSARYGLIEKFNHSYVLKKSPNDFLTTLEIGAGLGEHLAYENLSFLQQKNYVAVELRENMANKIKIKYPEVKVLVADCQQTLPYPDNYFDRILAIHVLEHLPDLPATIKEMHRVCNKENGQFSVVIPCEGGFAYSFARKISAQRLFEKRYKQSYKWFIEREHINLPSEILAELQGYFSIKQKRFFPFVIPAVNLNLCIGLTLLPK